MGRIGWCEGGASRRHTRQLTAWIPTGGGGTSGYLPLQDTSRDKGPLPALPGLQLLRGSGQGAGFPGHGRLEGASGYLPRLILYSQIAKVVEVGRCVPLTHISKVVFNYCHGRNTITLSM